MPHDARRARGAGALERDRARRDRAEDARLRARLGRTGRCKEAAIRAEFGVSPARYYQMLSALIDSPVALACTIRCWCADCSAFGTRGLAPAPPAPSESIRRQPGPDRLDDGHFPRGPVRRHSRRPHRVGAHRAPAQEGPRLARVRSGRSLATVVLVAGGLFVLSRFDPRFALDCRCFRRRRDPDADDDDRDPDRPSRSPIRRRSPTRSSWTTYRLGAQRHADPGPGRTAAADQIAGRRLARPGSARTRRSATERDHDLLHRRGVRGRRARHRAAPRRRPSVRSSRRRSPARPITVVLGADYVAARRLRIRPDGAETPNSGIRVTRMFNLC